MADLARQAEDAARALTALGIGRGDRVALWLPNCPEWFTLFIAAARIGAIAVMVNTRYRSAEVADIVSRSGAKALFLWPDFRGIDFPAILRDIDPGDLASLKALVSVFPAGEAGGDGDAARLGGIPALRFGEFLADGAASGRRPARGGRIAGGRRRHLHDVGDDQQTQIRAAQPAERDPPCHGTRSARFGMTENASPLIQTLPLCGVFGFCWAMATIGAGRPMLLEESFSAAATVRAIRDRRVHPPGRDRRHAPRHARSGRGR